MLKKKVALTMAALMTCLLAACGSSSAGKSKTEDTPQDGSIVTNLEKIDMSKWMYHSDDNVYYQTGIPYRDPGLHTVSRLSRVLCRKQDDEHKKALHL